LGQWTRPRAEAVDCARLQSLDLLLEASEDADPVACCMGIYERLPAITNAARPVYRSAHGGFYLAYFEQGAPWNAPAWWVFRPKGAQVVFDSAQATPFLFALGDAESPARVSDGWRCAAEVGPFPETSVAATLWPLECHEDQLRREAQMRDYEVHPSSILGKTVIVRGEGTGRCMSFDGDNVFRYGRHTIVFRPSGVKKRIKLLRNNNGKTPFSIEDPKPEATEAERVREEAANRATCCRSIAVQVTEQYADHGCSYAGAVDSSGKRTGPGKFTWACEAWGQADRVSWSGQWFGGRARGAGKWSWQSAAKVADGAGPEGDPLLFDGADACAWWDVEDLRARRGEVHARKLARLKAAGYAHGDAQAALLRFLGVMKKARVSLEAAATAPVAVSIPSEEVVAGREQRALLASLAGKARNALETAVTAPVAATTPSKGAVAGQEQHALLTSLARSVGLTSAGEVLERVLEQVLEQAGEALAALERAAAAPRIEAEEALVKSGCSAMEAHEAARVMGANAAAAREHVMNVQRPQQANAAQRASEQARLRDAHRRLRSAVGTRRSEVERLQAVQRAEEAAKEAACEALCAAPDVQCDATAVAAACNIVGATDENRVRQWLRLQQLNARRGATRAAVEAARTLPLSTHAEILAREDGRRSRELALHHRARDEAHRLRAEMRARLIEQGDCSAKRANDALAAVGHTDYGAAQTWLAVQERHAERVAALEVLRTFLVLEVNASPEEMAHAERSAGDGLGDNPQARADEVLTRRRVAAERVRRKDEAHALEQVQRTHREDIAALSAAAESVRAEAKVRAELLLMIQEPMKAALAAEARSLGGQSAPLHALQIMCDDAEGALLGSGIHLSPSQLLCALRSAADLNAASCVVGGRFVFVRTSAIENYRTGQPLVSAASITAPRTVESAHPYATGRSVTETLEFPGAKVLRVEFDSRCHTEAGLAQLHFYHDRQKRSRVVGGLRGGASQSNRWEPLIIRGSKLTVQFNTKSNSNPEQTHQSRHPYRPNENVRETIRMPSAKRMEVSFDPQCCTESGYDKLKFFCGGRCVATKEGRAPWQPITVEASEFEYRFTSDGSGQMWGYRFTVREVSDEVSEAISWSYERDAAVHRERVGSTVLAQSPRETVRQVSGRSFQDKRAWLRAKLKSRCSGAHHKVRVARRTFLSDVLRQASAWPLPHFRRSRWDIEFRGEPGIDAGGLRREFFTMLSRELCAPQLGAFISCGVGGVSRQLNPTSEFDCRPPALGGVRPDLQLYRLVGRLIGAALFQEELFTVILSRPLYKYITGGLVQVICCHHAPPLLLAVIASG
jgi:hypothetical protein